MILTLTIIVVYSVHSITRYHVALKRKKKLNTQILHPSMQRYHWSENVNANAKQLVVHVHLFYNVSVVAIIAVE